jgi:two-component system response regulator DegU
MPIMDGLEASRAIRESLPDVRIIMLTGYPDDLHITQALQNNINAYCLKSIRVERLLQVIEMVADGATWFDSGITESLARIMMEKTLPPGVETTFAHDAEQAPVFTERELDVLSLLTEGKSNREIADALCITIHTVKIHVGNIIQKMGVEDRTQVAIKALQYGLVNRKAPSR